MPYTFTHPSTTYPHLILHTLSGILTLPAALLFFLSLYALLLAGPTSPFVLLWPYIFSSAIICYILALERHALSAGTLSKRWYARLHVSKTVAMAMIYLPVLATLIFSRGLRTMLVQVAGYRNTFWQMMMWLNILSWILAVASLAYIPCFSLHDQSHVILPTHDSDIFLPTDGYSDERPSDELEEEDLRVPEATR